jgi:hypothetical protein
MILPISASLMRWIYRDESPQLAKIKYFRIAVLLNSVTCRIHLLEIQRRSKDESSMKHGEVFGKAEGVESQK